MPSSFLCARTMPGRRRRPSPQHSAVSTGVYRTESIHSPRWRRKARRGVPVSMLPQNSHGKGNRLVWPIRQPSETAFHIFYISVENMAAEKPSEPWPSVSALSGMSHAGQCRAHAGTSRTCCLPAISPNIFYISVENMYYAENIAYISYFLRV